jgi:hypothetical protein
MTLSTITDDFEGILRPKGPKYDIGAREFVSVVTALDRVRTISGQVLVYPNPSASQVTIRSQSPLHKVSLSNIQGELLFERPLSGELEAKLNIESLENGMYFIGVEMENGSVTQILLKR